MIRIIEVDRQDHVINSVSNIDRMMFDRAYQRLCYILSNELIWYCRATQSL